MQPPAQSLTGNTWIRMNRVLIFSDSLSLPRDYPELCEYHECWPQLLSKNHVIHQVAIGGATVDEIVSQTPYAKMFYPDVVILQCGIVDCSPRALKKSEIAFLQKIPFFGYRTLQFLQKRRVKLRKWRKIRYTKPEKFEEALKTLIARFPNIPVFAIGIVNPGDAYETEVPGILKSIEQYNALLERQFTTNFVDIKGIPMKGIMEDHHHLNPIGHRYIYELLNQRIEAHFSNS